jgi:hypothetical protein
VTYRRRVAGRTRPRPPTRTARTAWIEQAFLAYQAGRMSRDALTEVITTLRRAK